MSNLYAEMKRFLPVLERAADEPAIWDKLTAGTGITTLNGYRAAILAYEGGNEDGGLSELMRQRCPSCRLNWWLNPPAKVAYSDKVRCIECKTVYPAHMFVGTPPA